MSLTHTLPELDDILRLIEMGGEHVQARTLCRVEVGGKVFEVPSVSLGNPAREAPAIGYFGGVHGLERIGAEVVIAYLASLVQRLRWDEVLHHQLSQLRMVFMPLVNPGGLWLGTRVSGRGAPAVINLIYLPMAFLSGLWVPLHMLPSFLQSMAPAWPAYHLAQIAQAIVGVDVDGPLLLVRDREPGLTYSGSIVTPPSAALWG